MTKRIYKSHNIDIVNAYRTLFDITKLISSDVLNTLDLDVLKNVYRERVKETHPDRSKILGVNEILLSERFKEITAAYRKLTSYVEDKKFFRFNVYRSWKKTDSSQPYNAYKYSSPGFDFKKAYRTRDAKNEDIPTGQRTGKKSSLGLYPDMELPLGQYLYYSGVIDLHDLIQSVIWQRKHRPGYGTIAGEMKLLNREDISVIVKEKNRNEKFGECALRLGLLNTFQHKAILGRQRESQVPIGRYFVEKRILDQASLDYHLARQSKHNTHIRGKNSFRKKQG